MEAELRGHGLLPEGQSVVDGTAPLYYLTAPPPESAPAFRYSCLGQERYLQRYVPLPAVPASPPRHLDLAPQHRSDPIIYANGLRRGRHGIGFRRAWRHLFVLTAHPSALALAARGLHF